MTPVDALSAFSHSLKEPGPVWVACSGGPDSMALAWAASRVFGCRARVVHVDHGISSVSGAWAQLVVEAWRTQLEVRVLKAEVPQGGNLEARARAARYAALERLAGASEGVVLTAHTADDQVETVLMRMASGAGLQGLRGILPCRGRVRRPWLLVPRADVRGLAEAEGLPTVSDPSNRDWRFERARVRDALGRLSEALGQGWTARAARSVGLLQVAHELTSELAEPLAALWAAHPGWWQLDLSGWSARSDASRRWILADGLSRAGARRRGSGGHVSQLMACIAAGPGGSVNLAHGWVARIRQGALTVERRWPTPTPIPVERSKFSGAEWGPGLLHATPASAGDGELVVWPSERAWLRGPEPGDLVQRRGAPGRRPVGRALRDLGVPSGVRPAWPALADEEGLFWVAGLGTVRQRTTSVGESWIRWTTKA